MLDARQNDHASDSVPFTPQPGPGEYQFTPGCNATNISAPGWGNVTPFTVPDPDYFPMLTRPAVTDPEWLASLEEIRAYGASNSTVRTAEQTQIGLFYIEGSMTLVNRLARQLVAQEPVETNHSAAAKQLLAHARLFAALTISQADTQIRTWRVKYREHFWRPYTAINFLYPGHRDQLPVPGDELDAAQPDAVPSRVLRRAWHGDPGRHHRDPELPRQRYHRRDDHQHQPSRRYAALHEPESDHRGRQRRTRLHRVPLSVDDGAEQPARYRRRQLGERQHDDGASRERRRSRR